MSGTGGGRVRGKTARSDIEISDVFEDVSSGGKKILLM